MNCVASDVTATPHAQHQRQRQLNGRMKLKSDRIAIGLEAGSALLLASGSGSDSATDIVISDSVCNVIVVVGERLRPPAKITAA